MLPIPFLSNYIEAVVKKQLVADAVDNLNYYVTSLLLAFFAFGISCKQYFGSPIQCWVPMEFKGGWEKYAEDYCFIANFYHVPMHEEIEDRHRGDRLTYYRWVPIVLTLQAFFFYLPNYLWNILHRNTAINPTQYIEDAIKIRNMMGQDREKELDALADSFIEGVSVFGREKSRSGVAARSGKNATVLYLFIKLLYVTNVIGQMLILNEFLGGSYFSWGADTISAIARGDTWTEAEVFPRVILCDFSIRGMAQFRNYTVQCVIMMNMINEKLYLFLYVWFIFLISVTVANALYYLVMLTFAPLRARLVLTNSESKHHRLTRDQRARFVRDCLHPDGVLLLNFIREHAGGRVAMELTSRLMRRYEKSECTSSSSSCNSPSETLEKKPLMANGHHNWPGNRYDPPPKAGHLLPSNFVTPSHQQPPHHDHPHHASIESAPPLDIFDHRYPSTLRVGDRPSNYGHSVSSTPQPAPRSTMNSEGSGSLDHPDGAHAGHVNGVAAAVPRNSSPTDV